MAGEGWRKPETSPMEIRVAITAHGVPDDPETVVFRTELVRASNGQVLIRSDNVVHRNGMSQGWHAATPMELIGPAMVGGIRLMVGPPMTFAEARDPPRKPPLMSLRGWFAGWGRRR